MSFRITVLPLAILAVSGCAILGQSPELSDAGESNNGDGGTMMQPDVGMTNVGDGGATTNNDSDAGGGSDVANNSTTNNTTGPDSPCTHSIEAEDTSDPDRVVGTGSPDSCTFEAVRSAIVDGGGVITFNCGGPVVIDVTEEIVTTNSFVLDGGGEVTLSGGSNNRILNIDGQTSSTRPGVAIQNISFRDGSVSGATDRCGAAIRRNGGQLKLVDVTFRNNVCDSGDGGAVASSGPHPLQLLRVNFIGNSTTGDGGGMSVSAGDVEVIDSLFSGNVATSRGGLSTASGSVRICGTTFEDNSATDQSGGFGHSLWEPTEKIELEHLVIARNHADALAGGAFVFGEGRVEARNLSVVDNTAGESAGIRFQRSDVLMENSTIARNAADGGEGGLSVWDCDGSIFRHLTIVENDALGSLSFKGGIGGNNPVVLHNSIVANNFGGNPGAPPNCGFTNDSLGGNVQYPRTRDDGGDDTKCTEDVLFADPRLVESDDGLTYAPEAGSAAIGNGVDCLEVDQLGNPRPAQGCTSGAIE